MSTNLTAPVDQSPQHHKPKTPRAKLSYPKVLLIVSGSLILLSLLRVITGATNLTDRKSVV